jgi:DNA-binding response OmpR family regulator
MPTTESSFRCRELTIDFLSKQVVAWGQEVKLSPTEYRLRRAWRPTLGE